MFSEVAEIGQFQQPLKTRMILFLNFTALMQFPILIIILLLLTICTTKFLTYELSSRTGSHV